MFTALDHLIVAVEDLDKAEKNYSKIFGLSPVWKGEHKEFGTSNCLFNFQNTYFELLSVTGNGPGAALVIDHLANKGEGLIGTVFGTDNIDSVTARFREEGFAVADPSNGEGTNCQDQHVRKWKNLFLPSELTRGLLSFVIQHTEGELSSPKAYKPSSVRKLDHLVIKTNDADGFIDIYRDSFNIRLALDKVVERWKSRMLFFRFNKTTIEVVEKKDDQAPKDELWGLTWDVENIEQAHKRLLSEGVDVTPIKKGIKENTLVATIKSHTHNVPTLLIEHLE
ncbi:VOC family protein [Porticoccaceae bacterium]|nr:VOC family protein [Porticoccaceae bacterium]MDB9736750.1 VOC family protein [Porticoccaceae bacterium]MDB9969923.1 VOC family protein [Porticoccaceae bacterium]MDC0011545.1 VOC family protein [Porticoccaceae bacterium]